MTAISSAFRVVGECEIRRNREEKVRRLVAKVPIISSYSAQSSPDFPRVGENQAK